MNTMAGPANGPPDLSADRLIYQTTAHVQPIVNQLTELIDSANFSDGAAVHDLLTIVRDQLQLSLNVENHLERYNILLKKIYACQQKTMISQQLLTKTSNVSMNSLMTVTAGAHKLRISPHGLTPPSARLLTLRNSLATNLSFAHS